MRFANKNLTCSVKANHTHWTKLKVNMTSSQIFTQESLEENEVRCHGLSDLERISICKLKLQLFDTSLCRSVSEYLESQARWFVS